VSARCGGEQRIVGADRARLAAELKLRYEQGVTLRTLAETTAHSYGFVRDVLTAAGVSLRMRGRRHRCVTETS